MLVGWEIWAGLFKFLMCAFLRAYRCGMVEGLLEMDLIVHVEQANLIMK